MNLNDLIYAQRAGILQIAARYGAHNLCVFRSVARGKARPDSVLDVLIERDPGHTLLNQGALGQDLEYLLGCKVDLVEPASLH